MEEAPSRKRADPRGRHRAIESRRKGPHGGTGRPGAAAAGPAADGDWTALPMNALNVIFAHIARHDLCSILRVVLRVCRHWRTAWREARQIEDGGVWQAVRTLNAGPLWPGHAPLWSGAGDGEAARTAGEGLARIVRRCGQLRSLSLHGCQGVRPKVLRSAAPSLRTLDARVRPSGANDVWLRTIGECFPGLTSLHIGRTSAPDHQAANTGATKRGLSAVARCCPRLQHLDVRHMQPLIDVHEICDIAAELPRLTRLDIAITSPRAWRSRRPLMSLATAFPRLRVLDVLGTRASDLDERHYSLGDRFPNVEIRNKPSAEDFASPSAPPRPRARRLRSKTASVALTPRAHAPHGPQCAGHADP